MYFDDDMDDTPKPTPTPQQEPEVGTRHWKRLLPYLCDPMMFKTLTGDEKAALYDGLSESNTPITLNKEPFVLYLSYAFEHESNLDAFFEHTSHLQGIVTISDKDAKLIDEDREQFLNSIRAIYWSINLLLLNDEQEDQITELLWPLVSHDDELFGRLLDAARSNAFSRKIIELGHDPFDAEGPFQTTDLPNYLREYAENYYLNLQAKAKEDAADETTPDNDISASFMI